MKKLIISVLIILAASTAQAKKADWTYAFYISDKNADVSAICASFSSHPNDKIAVYHGSAYTDCSKNEKKQLSISEFFSKAKTENDSWKYLFAVSAGNRLTAENIAREIGLLRPSILLLDIDNMGRLENLYDLNSVSPAVSVFSSESPAEGFDYVSFLSASGGLTINEDVETAALNTVKKQTESSGSKVSFFTIETGDGFEGLISLFDERAKCFDKKIDRFTKIQSVDGQYTDLRSALDIINRMITRKLKPVMKNSYSSVDGVTGPLLYFPAGKAEFEKTKGAYMKTSLHKKYPNWLEFLEVLYVK